MAARRKKSRLARRKKVVRKKKPARKKKAVRKKKTTRKEAIRKKAVRKKATRKKAPARKAPARAAAVPRKKPRPIVSRPEPVVARPTPEVRAPAPAPAPAVAPAPVERLVGRVTHYFPNVDAAIVQVEAGVIAVGDTLHFKGHTTDFTQRVDRIELEHQEIPIAHPGQIIGVHVSERVREHDEVLKR